MSDIAQQVLPLLERIHHAVVEGTFVDMTVDHSAGFRELKPEERTPPFSEWRQWAPTRVETIEICVTIPTVDAT